MDLNKDRFLNEEEFKKFQAAEAERGRAPSSQKLTPAPAAQPRPAPRRSPPQPPPAPRARRQACRKERGECVAPSNGEGPRGNRKGTPRRARDDSYHRSKSRFCHPDRRATCFDPCSLGTCASRWTADITSARSSGIPYPGLAAGRQHFGVCRDVLARYRLRGRSRRAATSAALSLSVLVSTIW